MFCTGGIRCEKSTNFLIGEGVEDVFHLKGGILKYLEEVPAEESRWEGECFVFDERVAVDNNRSPGAYVQCHGCRRALAAEDLKHPDYEPGICCARCVDRITPRQRRQFAERRRQVALADSRGEAHIGKVFPVRRSDQE